MGVDLGLVALRHLAYRRRLSRAMLLGLDEVLDQALGHLLARRLNAVLAIVLESLLELFAELLRS